MTIVHAPSDRRARLAELRRKIGMIERGFGAGAAGRSAAIAAAPDAPGHWLPFGGEIDRRLRSGQRPALHELVADGYGSRPAVRDVGLMLAASLLHQQRHADALPLVLCCQRQRDQGEFGRLYGPGLLHLGLRPEQLIMVSGRRDADCLWAMEQGLRSRSLAVVIGMLEEADLIASRRLSLAASAHRTWCLLLPALHGRQPSAASARWRVGAAMSAADRLDGKLPGRPRWQLTLERSRSGQSGRWIVEWDHAAYRFHLAAPMADRPMATRHGRSQGGAGILSLDRAG